MARTGDGQRRDLGARPHNAWCTPRGPEQLRALAPIHPTTGRGVPRPHNPKVPAPRTPRGPPALPRGQTSLPRSCPSLQAGGCGSQTGIKGAGLWPSRPGPGAVPRPPHRPVPRPLPARLRCLRAPYSSSACRHPKPSWELRADSASPLRAQPRASVGGRGQPRLPPAPGRGQGAARPRRPQTCGASISPRAPGGPPRRGPAPTGFAPPPPRGSDGSANQVPPTSLSPQSASALDPTWAGSLRGRSHLAPRGFPGWPTLR